MSRCWHRPSIHCSIERMTRFLWTALGVFSLGLGAIGVILPLLPTTPLVLFAAFSFAKGSPRLRQRLVEHRIFGPIIADWERHGAISRRYKILACVAMGAVLLASFLAQLSAVIIAVQAVCMGAGATYVLSRPSTPHPITKR